MTASRAGAAVSWAAFFSTYLPALVLALGTGIALPALPALARSFGVGFGLASGVVTAFLLGNLAGTIPSGYFIDRFGRRPVLIAGPLLSSAIAFLVAGSNSFPELLVLRFLNGFAAQMWVMARLAAISENSAPGQRGRLVSWMYGMDNTGKLAGPVLGGFIAGAWGSRAPFFVYACLALTALIPTVLASQYDRSRSKGDRVAARAALPAQPLHKIVLPRLAYFAVSLFAGLTRGPIDADLLHLYAAFAYHLDPRQIGYLATSAAVLSWPIGLVAGWLLDHFGRRFSTIPGFVGIAIAMVALAMSAFLQLSFAWYVALFLLGIALYALTSGSIQTLGTDVAPPEARGAFLGLWRFVGQGGSALSPILFAVFADRLNYGSSFLFMAGSAIIVAFLIIRYVPEGDHRPSPSS